MAKQLFDILVSAAEKHSSGIMIRALLAALKEPGSLPIIFSSIARDKHGIPRHFNKWAVCLYCTVSVPST